MTSRDLINRRSFLRHVTGTAMGFSAVNALTDLRLIQNALAQSSGGGQFSDYKALVCFFFNGGNDANNMLIPFTPAEYTAYSAARTAVALWDDPANVTTANPYYIMPLSTTNTAGRPFGIHSSCPELKTLFDTGKLAFQSNVGTLVEPITKSQYQSGTRRRPSQLFSHNDQVVQWQTSIPDQISPTGWGGRMADIIRDSSWAGTGNRLSLSISASGFNTWQVGKLEHLYQVSRAPIGVSAEGAKTLKAFTSSPTSPTYAARTAKIREIIAQGAGATNLFEKDANGILDSAVDAADTLNSALGGVAAADNTAINGRFDPLLANTELSQTRDVAGQMKMVAKMIASRGALGIKRQIFFVSLGGFDTHGSQLLAHSNLMRAASKNIMAFYQCMQDFGIGDKVTLFTASDFNRTYASNGLGSDHAWGTHSIICGGAVDGGRVHGTFQTPVIGGPDDITRGSWIPTTSVDEYSATLAKWFGVTDPNLDLIFPNLRRFASRDLGYFV
jgi:uncharacterized protein (DUF1501 family)